MSQKGQLAQIPYLRSACLYFPQSSFLKCQVIIDILPLHNRDQIRVCSLWLAMNYVALSSVVEGKVKYYLSLSKVEEEGDMSKT